MTTTHPTNIVEVGRSRPHSSSVRTIRFLSELYIYPPAQKQTQWVSMNGVLRRHVLPFTTVFSCLFFIGVFSLLCFIFAERRVLLLTLGALALPGICGNDISQHPIPAGGRIGSAQDLLYFNVLLQSFKKLSPPLQIQLQVRLHPLHSPGNRVGIPGDQEKRNGN